MLISVSWLVIIFVVTSHPTSHHAPTACPCKLQSAVNSCCHGQLVWLPLLGFERAALRLAHARRDASFHDFRRICCAAAAAVLPETRDRRPDALNRSLLHHDQARFHSFPC